jgi:YD repeat-containing protein
MEVFIYVAYYLKEKVGSATRIVEHSDWRLFFLDPPKVEQMFIRAQQDTWLTYHAAGRVIRLDWYHSNLMEAVDAIAQRAHSVA